MLSARRQGFYLAMKVFDYSRPGVAAAAVGLQRRCLDESVKYASEREAFGVPIYQHQAIGHKIADMAINYNASRLLVWQAAWNVDNGVVNPQIPAFASHSRRMARMRDRCVPIRRFGFMDEYPVAKLLAT